MPAPPAPTPRLLITPPDPFWVTPPPIIERRVVEELPSGLGALLRLGDDGPAKRPLISSPVRPGRLVKAVAAATGVAMTTISLLAVGSTVFAATTAGEDTTVVATYTRPDGTETDLRDVTCLSLADDIVSTRHLVEDNPGELAPVKLRMARAIRDNTAEIAELRQGDVAREALACQAKGTWLEGFKRNVTFTLTVHGAESSMGSTIVRAEDRGRSGE